MATRWYRSPELVVTNRYSFPVDIWSVGCILGELIDGEPMFPGDDALDQLVKIYQLAGPLDRKLLKQMESMFGVNAHKLLGPKSATASRQEICRKKLKARYKKKINSQALDLLTRLLDNNADTRPTARQALRHGWFADLLEKDTDLSKKLQTGCNRAEKLNIERILGDLTVTSENRAQNQPARDSDKREKIFRFSDMQQTESRSKPKRGRVGPSGAQKDHKRDPAPETSVAKRFYGGFRPAPFRQQKENLENKSRALINEKIRQKNFSVTKNSKKLKTNLKMGFSMIPKLNELSSRSRETKGAGMKSFVNANLHGDKRRMQGVSMGKSLAKKPFLKKKSKTTQLKSKVYQNTFSCLGYKINHKLGSLHKHLNQKRLQDADKSRPLNDRKKRRIKERKSNQMTAPGSACSH